MHTRQAGTVFLVRIGSLRALQEKQRCGVGVVHTQGLGHAIYLDPLESQ